MLWPSINIATPTNLIFFTVTTPELERIQEAYKRACGFAGIMKETVFIRDVLGDSVPIKLGQVCSQQTKIAFHAIEF